MHKHIWTELVDISCICKYHNEHDISHDLSGQIIATSHDLTPNGGLVRESPQNGLKLG